MWPKDGWGRIVVELWVNFFLGPKEEREMPLSNSCELFCWRIFYLVCIFISLFFFLFLHYDSDPHRICQKGFSIILFFIDEFNAGGSESSSFHLCKNPAIRLLPCSHSASSSKTSRQLDFSGEPVIKERLGSITYQLRVLGQLEFRKFFLLLSYIGRLVLAISFFFFKIKII